MENESALLCSKGNGKMFTPPPNCLAGYSSVPPVTHDWPPSVFTRELKYYFTSLNFYTVVPNDVHNERHERVLK